MPEKKEYESVDETIEAASGIEPGNVTATAVVQSTTEKMPTAASKSSLPNAMDTDPEAPPVHTARPDTPIAQTLAAGAGEHTPPDPKEFDSEGRPRD